MRSEVSGVDQKLPRRIVALADPCDDVSPRVSLGVKPQMMRTRDLESELVVLRGSAPDENANLTVAHEGAKGRFFSLKLRRRAGFRSLESEVFWSERLGPREE
jgi:hypothetical protein